MKNNKRFLRNKPSKEAIEGLFMLYGKNPALKTLVKKFDLDITGARAAPLEKSTDKNNSEKLIPMDKKKYKNEVEEIEQDFEMEFVSINENEEIEGVIFGDVKEIKNNDRTNKCYVIEIDGEKKMLPSNLILNRKLANLVEINKKTLSKGIDVCIVFDGWTKVEGSSNKAKNFKVFSA